MSDDAKPERQTGLPAFEQSGVVFECWTVGTGGAAYMVWRALVGGRRLVVGRIIGEHTVIEDGATVVRKRALWWARCDGRLIGREYASTRDAIFYAVDAARQSGEVVA